MQGEQKTAAHVTVSVRFVNDYGKTRRTSVVFRVLLAIISGCVAVWQGIAQSLFSPVCLYWVVLFALNMYELGLVNVDIERQKKLIREALKKGMEDKEDGI